MRYLKWTNKQTLCHLPLDTNMNKYSVRILYPVYYWHIHFFSFYVSCKTNLIPISFLFEGFGNAVHDLGKDWRPLYWRPWRWHNGGQTTCHRRSGIMQILDESVEYSLARAYHLYHNSHTFDWQLIYRFKFSVYPWLQMRRTCRLTGTDSEIHLQNESSLCEST